jgi:hypothetical protein
MPCHFEFQCYGIVFPALAYTGPSGTTLQISADAGPLPCSVENIDSRARLQNLVRQMRRKFPGQLVVSDSQRLTLSEEIEIDGPVTAVSIFKVVTKPVLGMRPLINLLKTQF